MRFSSTPPPETFPERQKLACSLRFGAPGPQLSYRVIARVMGISRQRAWELVKLGKARMRALGRDVKDPIAQAAA